MADFSAPHCKQGKNFTMKKILGVFVVLGVVASLSGCGDSTHDVAYYKAHDKERTATLKECRNDASKDATANCQNAEKAAFTAGGNENFKIKGTPFH